MACGWKWRYNVSVQIKLINHAQQNHADERPTCNHQLNKPKELAISQENAKKPTSDEAIFLKNPPAKLIYSKVQNSIFFMYKVPSLVNLVQLSTKNEVIKLQRTWHNNYWRSTTAHITSSRIPLNRNKRTQKFQYQLHYDMRKLCCELSVESLKYRTDGALY